MVHVQLQTRNLGKENNRAGDADVVVPGGRRREKLEPTSEKAWWRLAKGQQNRLTPRRFVACGLGSAHTGAQNGNDGGGVDGLTRWMGHRTAANYDRLANQLSFVWPRSVKNKYRRRVVK
ncbi:hypothetical protein Bbelb_232860 [Branchiostoma belcheri]|nr:hypothetical protein Bbelb_232860 [Branchiostoma belcheri]